MLLFRLVDFVAVLTHLGVATDGVRSRRRQLSRVGTTCSSPLDEARGSCPVLTIIGLMLGLRATWGLMRDILRLSMLDTADPHKVILVLIGYHNLLIRSCLIHIAGSVRWLLHIWVYRMLRKVLREWHFGLIGAQFAIQINHLLESCSCIHLLHGLMLLLLLELHLLLLLLRNILG